MANSSNDTSVLIAGAGPTGLVMALWLKRRGIRFRIFDKSSAPGQTSRALAVQARTLEFYSQLGIADSLVNAGITVPEFIMRRMGRIVAVAKLGMLGKKLSPFPYLLFCSQDVHEALLCDILKAEGVEIERNSELIAISQDADRVTATVRSHRGEETVTTDYLCGCDGAHHRFSRWYLFSSLFCGRCHGDR
jgi:2-polyprenyl-6-methoxyphenol hydroxylase-like FAD-dependent oxidoreductase